MAPAKRKPSRVLADHTRAGKKFIPPLIATLGPFTEIAWVNDLVPEFLWLELLNRKYDLRTGAELASRLALATLNTRGTNNKKWFALASAYGALETAEQAAVVEQLEASAILAPIQEALLPLQMFYPQCPLNFLVKAPQKTDHKLLGQIEGAVESCFYKQESAATFVQATAIYIAFRSDILKVFEGLALANFPAIEEFPHTEESKRVAAAVRCAVLTLHGHFKDARSATWTTYFWNRGLELVPCRLQIEVP